MVMAFSGTGTLNSRRISSRVEALADRLDIGTIEAWATIYAEDALGVILAHRVLDRITEQRPTIKFTHALLDQWAQVARGELIEDLPRMAEEMFLVLSSLKRHAYADNPDACDIAEAAAGTLELALPAVLDQWREGGTA